MSSNLVIVALPAEDDRVWKISSEKVPHLTLLFLGDATNNPNVEQITQFVEHATTLSEHGPFYLDVDHRGELGPDKADVIFFSKRSWNLKWIKQFRGQLLQNQQIKTAYDSTQQYEEWTPHLTLGYPTAPAKPMPSDGFDHSLYSVSFDRIAVWTGDFAGPEFRLEYPDREMEDTFPAMWSAVAKKGEEAIDDLLHFGVKGMRWGVRKQDVPGGGHLRISQKSNVAAVSTKSQLALMTVGPFALASPRFRSEYKAAGAHNKARRIEKKAVKQDKKWEKQIYTTDAAVRVHNAMADHFNSRIDSINSKPEYKDLNLHDNPNSDLSKKYMKEVDSLTMAGYSSAVQSVHGVSPSGRKVAQLSADGQSIKIVGANTVKHDSETVDDVVFRVRWNDQGHVIEMNKAEVAPSLQQMMALGAEFIEHHGIKGMKWGVRNRKGVPVAVAPTATVKIPHGTKRKTKIEVVGGENHDAAPDAVKVAKTKAKFQKSGAAALSNQELKDLQERINLERNVSQLVVSTSTLNRGRKFVRSLTGFNKEVNDTFGTGLQTVRLANQARGN